jgi:hypothetical protein
MCFFENNVTLPFVAKRDNSTVASRPKSLQKDSKTSRRKNLISSENWWACGRRFCTRSAEICFSAILHFSFCASRILQRCHIGTAVSLTMLSLVQWVANGYISLLGTYLLFSNIVFYQNF